MATLTERTRCGPNSPSGRPFGLTELPSALTRCGPNSPSGRPFGLMTLSQHDNVAVALRPLHAGDTVACNGAMLTLDRDIAIGHKVAVRAIAVGETIVKYQCPIGIATLPIEPGAYVHTHNVRSGYLPTYTLPA